MVALVAARPGPVIVGVAASVGVHNASLEVALVTSVAVPLMRGHSKDPEDAYVGVASHVKMGAPARFVEVGSVSVALSVVAPRGVRWCMRAV